MGNGSSQSIVLGPPRLQATCPVRNGYHYQRGGVPKYVHPQNRVLPKPVAGQRLRSTDNGSILQTAGTIRGQRRDSLGREDESGDPEVMGILRKRSEIIEKENDCYQQFNLRNHRMFHSDPDIARRPDFSGYPEDGFNNRRQSGAAARASKLKCKKKARAPEPPGESLLRDRRQQQSEEERLNQKNCRCINKSKAPQPPAIVVHPPPPPPLPSSVTTRTKINANDRFQKCQGEASSRSPSVTRSVECHENRPNYEKNVHPLEKWRNYRSTGDVRIDEQDEPLHGSRTTVFDSKKLSDSQTKLPSHLPYRPDPFQKEIQAVTKKIAETRKDNSPAAIDKVSSAKNVAPPVKQNTNSPPKFYFADTGVFKMGNASSKTDSSAITNKPLTKCTPLENKLTVESNQRKNIEQHRRDLPQQCTTIDEIVPSLQRFSPARRRYKSPTRNSGLSSQQNAEKEWEDLSRNLCNKAEDSDIDIRLRPVLPRKPPEMPKFSPSEAWQALGSDGLGSSNQSTSDDGPEPLFKNEVSPQYNSEDGRPRRFSDMAFNRYDRGNVFKHRSLSDSHWTPIQDLLDDSDVSSDDSEEAVVPRIRPGSNEISTRFSLPTVMFSNMRPIGCEMKANLSAVPYVNDNVNKVKQSKKTTPKYSEPSDHGLAPHFRKFLSKRNKYLSEEDIAVSDSNWTFGQYGLQKRGKQYSSELMLSDKKKNELMRKSNFSDFLGDILVSKANHMRSQMKSSDSGNSNFSFYSTEGQIMFLPEKESLIKEAECSPPTKGRVYDIRRKFDPNIEPKKPNYWGKASKKPNPTDLALGRKRDLELAKMLEDEVRKRRNKEKINIRQQLQRMKNLHSDEEEDDFDDEAYFTEPKSREESQSPFFTSGIQRHFLGSDIGFQSSHYFGGAASGSRLSHWQSSPALLEDNITQIGNRPVFKGRQSSSSLMSSPDPETWTQTKAVVEPWLQRQRHLDKVEDSRLAITTTDTANDGDVSSSPTPALQKKERRKTNIYKQLMDIVRKEEKHLKKAEQADPNSPESSQRESSPSTCSESSSTSSYSYSDSSGSRNHEKNGVPANKEFHTSGYTNSGAGSSGAMPSFQVAFVQPYHPSKSYRPVPFDVVTPSGYRMRDLQEERKQLQAEAS